MPSEKFIIQLLEDSLQRALKSMLPQIIGELMSKNQFFIGQEFIWIDEAANRYNLSKRTLYNYHHRQYITLRSTDGKTYVSILELEAHIKNNPIKCSMK